MRGWVWRLYLGAGAIATGVYYLLSPGPRAVLNVVVGASAVAAIAVGIAWHRPARRLAWWLAGGRFQLESRPGAGAVLRATFTIPSAA